MLQPSQKLRRRGIYIMYHRTRVTSARLIIPNSFKQSKDGMLGAGVYVTRDANKASPYPLTLDPADRVVRVKRIDWDNHPIQKTWRSHGYDTAWVPPNAGLQSVLSDLEEDCVFNPKRVKVVGITVAPNYTVKVELQHLLAQKAAKKRGHGHRGHDACALCKRKTHHDAVHTKQQCWKCGQQICTFMSKRSCSARP